jgi:hypothetical protein
MVDSTTNQLKLGTFSKLLEKEKTRDVIKQLLPKQSYQSLQRLQKLSGNLAESAQKFLNTSKSGITIEDAGIVMKIISDIGNILSGNPWPLVRSGLGVAGARYLTKLFGDPAFLKLVEDLILAIDSNQPTAMAQLGNIIAQRAKVILNPSVQEE